MAQAIIDNVPHDKVVLLGDSFDDFGDTPEQNANTAKWLENFLSKENHIGLLGNHDISYKYPSRYTSCSGFEIMKFNRINATINRDVWDKTKLFHIEQGFLLSHAGLTRRLYKILNRYDESADSIEHVEKVLNDYLPEVENALKHKTDHVLIAPGYARGGHEPFGGLTWCDLSEFKPIPNVNQVFGHTPRKVPDIIFRRSDGPIKISAYDQIDLKAVDKLCSVNYAIDTGLRYYAIIENGEVSIHKSKVKFSLDGVTVKWIE